MPKQQIYEMFNIFVDRQSDGQMDGLDGHFTNVPGPSRPMGVGDKIPGLSIKFLLNV